MQRIRWVTWLACTATALAQQPPALSSTEMARFVARLADAASAPEAVDELVAMGARALPVIEGALAGNAVARRSAFLVLDQLGRDGLPLLVDAADSLHSEVDREASAAGMRAVGTLVLHADVEQLQAVDAGRFMNLAKQDHLDGMGRLIARAERHAADEAILIARLQGQDMLNREVAADLLAASGTAVSLPALQQALRSSHQGPSTVRVQRGRGGVAVFWEKHDLTSDIHLAAARAIVRIEPRRDGSAAAYSRLLSSAFRRERIEAAIALATLSIPLPDRQLVGEALTAALATQDAGLLRHLIVAAGTFGLQGEKALKRIRELAAGEDRELAAIAAATLKRLPAK